MSLDWNLTACAEDAPIRDKDGNLTGLAQTMIFASMFVQMGEITKDNFGEFTHRCAIYERALGALRNNGKDLFINVDEVKSFIGLKTNVETKKFNAFQTHVGRTVVDRIIRDIAADASDAKKAKK